MLTPLLAEHFHTAAQNSGYLHCADGNLRAGWSPLLETMMRLGPEVRRARSEEIQRLLRENGVTFAHDDQTGRSWQLDLMPLVVDGTTWQRLAVGLEQRSRLLSALYHDLYGEKRMLSEGLLPVELLHSSHGMLLPCDRALPEGTAPIAFHAVDLALDAQGTWRVRSDHLQRPTGAGFALENRILLARALPELYREAPLHRLAGFLEAHHDMLVGLARSARDQPNIVLLTPGARSPYYFEHAYLANYLNLTLAEGQDMVARDGKVWLRTLGGLEPIHVLLRRCADIWCDPLELRGDSLLGVPALLQSSRTGGITLANALGVSLLEHPGLAPFMAQLCERLLGETLQLDGPESHWCGDPQGLAWATGQRDVLEFIDMDAPDEPHRLPSLPAHQAAELWQQICAQPARWVARRPLQPAAAPTFNAGLDALEPTPFNLRTFTTLAPDSCYQPPGLGRFRVMPGGLAWAGTSGSPLLSSHLVKDVWITAEQPQPHISRLRQASGPIMVTRDGADLPSRVAESLFWMGRYGERFDLRSRLLREALVELTEVDQQAPGESSLDDLIRALALIPVDAENRIASLRATLLGVFDPNQFNSLPQLFHYLLHNAQSVREHLGDDAWRVLHQLEQRVSACSAELDASAGRRNTEHLSVQMAALFGLCNETMPHHYGWRFMDIGRFIERVLALLDLLRLTLQGSSMAGSMPLWEVILSSTDNVTAYRRRYRSALHPAAVVDLLMFDEANPRSVGYMLKRLARQIERLPQPDGTPYRSAETRLIIEATSALHLANIEQLSELAQDAEARDALAELIERLKRPLMALSDAISHSHFSHAEQPRQMVKMELF